MEETLNSYRLLSPFHNDNAGFSRWTTAEKGGKIFFVKEFLSPIYPCDDSLSPAIRKKRIDECALFEKTKKALYDRINKASDGNVVRILDFFRYESHYYIVTDCIEHEGIDIEALQKIPFAERLQICMGLAHSLMCLHKAGIVHADIKEANVLLHRTESGQIVAKLIDFDASFNEFTRPESDDDLGGDQVYLSPEACMFLCGEDIELTCQMDTFSLGLLFHQYLTGKLPEFDHNEYDYAHEAVIDAKDLVVDSSLPFDIAKTLRDMLICGARNRIGTEDIFKRFTGHIKKKDIIQKTAPNDYANTSFYTDNRLIEDDEKEERVLTENPEQEFESNRWMWVLATTVCALAIVIFGIIGFYASENTKEDDNNITTQEERRKQLESSFSSGKITEEKKTTESTTESKKTTAQSTTESKKTTAQSTAESKKTTAQSTTENKKTITQSTTEVEKTTQQTTVSPIHVHTWETRTVTDKEAWDEQVVVKEAWDEQIIVEEAWTEMHLEYHIVCPECGLNDYYPDSVAVPLFIDGYYCPNCGKATLLGNCEITGYIEEEHPAEYQTVHHDAEYQTVHHDAVTHTETYCSSCGVVQ